MDRGRVAEFGEPLELFDREGMGERSLFRALCEEAHLSRSEIVRIRSGAEFVSGEHELAGL